MQLLLLMLIPILVVLAATFVFYTRIGLPSGTKNKGTLITPPVQIATFSLKDDKGNPVVINHEKEQDWTFLEVMGSACDEACRQRSWEIRQTRIALGKYQGHIRRAWLMRAGPADESMTAWRQQEHQDVQELFVDAGAWENAKKEAGLVDENQARFYLVDPRGFIMMYYTGSDTYKDVMADMKFLLKGVE